MKAMIDATALQRYLEEEMELTVKVKRSLILAIASNEQILKELDDKVFTAACLAILAAYRKENTK